MLARLARIPPSAATSAKTTDSAVTASGFGDHRCAAAAGVIARLSTSSVPTTWAASVTVNASTSRNTRPSSRTGTPRAVATSASTDANSNGRYTTAMHDHDDDADHDEREQLVVAHAEDVAEQDVGRGRREAVVVAEQQHADPEAEREDDADRGVTLAFASHRARR